MTSRKTFIPKEYRPKIPGTDLNNNYAKHSVCFVPKRKASAVVLIASSGDVVANAFYNDILGNQISNVLRLEYDGLGKLCDFSYSKDHLTIYTQSTSITPISIYHRHPGISMNHPYFNKHTAFLDVLDLWTGNLLGQTRYHYSNTSKLYQQFFTINECLKKSRCKRITVPDSFVLKGSKRGQLSSLPKNAIVKSLSSCRSKVVTNETFKSWNVQSLNVIPTLFQDYIEGEDIRVHVSDDFLWCLKILNKDTVDYRYSTKGTVKYTEFLPTEELSCFCKNLRDAEENRLIGIDFVKRNGTLFCLESNPGPGWSTFHHSSKPKFTLALLKSMNLKIQGDNLC